MDEHRVFVITQRCASIHSRPEDGAEQQLQEKSYAQFLPFLR